MSNVGIYVIYNNETFDFYIGSSVNIKRRLTTHRSKLKKNKHVNKYLQNAVNKYGLDRFTFVMIRECLVEDLRFWEQLYILKLEPKYNIEIEVGKGLSLVGHTRVSRKKIKENNARYWKGKKRSKRTINKLKNLTGENSWHFGKKRSKETCEKISKATKGKIIPKDSKLKMALAKGAKPFNVYNKKDGTFVGRFINRSECASVLGIDHTKVCACLRKDRKSHKGFIFKYAGEILENVVDMERLPKYHLKSNRNLLENG